MEQNFSGPLWPSKGWFSLAHNHKYRYAQVQTPTSNLVSEYSHDKEVAFSYSACRFVRQKET